MFKVKLLLSLLVVSSANLFAVKDLMSFLPEERRKQVEKASGYSFVNARFAATQFVADQVPTLATALGVQLRERVMKLFEDGRPVVADSDIYSIIYTFACDNPSIGIEEIPGYDRSDFPGVCADLVELDDEEDVEPEVGTKEKPELSLSAFMSEVEASRAAEFRGYSQDELIEALRLFLSKNVTSLSKKDIQVIEEKWRVKYFKSTAGDKRLMCMDTAPMDAVDEDLTRLMKKYKVDVDSVIVPEKIEHCAVCRGDIQEGTTTKRCFGGHSYHKECLVRPNRSIMCECGLCRLPFPGNWHGHVRCKHLGFVDRCMSLGVDINSVDQDGFTALILATLYDHKEIVEKLIVAGADINLGNLCGDTALIVAAKRGNKTLVHRLIEARANVNAANIYGKNALMIAAEQGYQEISGILLVAAANVNAVDFYGNTALILAAKRGGKKTVQVLLGFSAKVNVAGHLGCTALILAAEKNYKEIVEKLIELDADVNAANWYGDTALILAARNGHKEVVERLIEASANVNTANRYRDTALILAAKMGHKEVVEKLTDVGADINAVNKDGKTALMMANGKSHKEIVELLLARGAKESEAKE